MFSNPICVCPSGVIQGFAQFLTARRFLADAPEFAQDQAHGLLDLRRIDAGVDAEEPGIGQRDHAALDRITKAVLLAQPLEQARTHVLADDHAEQLEREPVLVVAPKRMEPHREVGLLGLLGVQGDALAVAAGAPAGVARQRPGAEARERAEHGEEILVGRSCRRR